MSTDALFWALKQRIGRPVENLVLIHLADRADTDDESFPSVAYFEDRTGLNRKTVISALDSLESKGYIRDTGRRKGATGKVKVYWLNLETGTVPKKELLDEIVPFFPEIVPETDGNSTKSGTQILLVDTISDTNKEKENKKEKEPVQPSGFTEFWSCYPSHPRKGGKNKCLKIWLTKKLESQAQQILAHLAWQKKDWAASNNRFVQEPSSYLNAAKWDGWTDVGEPRRERGLVT